MAEKFPFLFAARSFLFGLIEVPAWGYWYGYSNAYLELMCMDGVVHDLRDKSKMGPNSPSAESLERTRIAYMKMMKEKEALKVKNSPDAALNKKDE